MNRDSLLLLLGMAFTVGNSLLIGASCQGYLGRVSGLLPGGLCLISIVMLVVTVAFGDREKRSHLTFLAAMLWILLVVMNFAAMMSIGIVL